MKKRVFFKEEKNFYSVIESDRIGVAGRSLELLKRELAGTLSHYFGQVSLPEIKLDKTDDCFSLSITAKCSSVKAPSEIIG